MSDQQLKIVIGADVNQGVAGLNKFNDALAKTGQAMAKIAPGSNSAGQSLLNLGRIAQDAPFGFIGIANNINPLLESFQRLKAESGSTGGALKALAGSLGGAGGLGLAVSIGTALLTLFAQGFFKTKKAIDETAESTKKFAEAQHSSQVALAKQVIEVESLVRIARSDISTKEEQANALTKLNELIPDNIGKLDALNIKTEEGIGIVRRYTSALVDQAASQLFIGRSAEIEAKKFDQFEEFVNTQADLVLKLKATQATLAKSSKGLTPGALEERARLADNIDSIKGELKRNEKNWADSRRALNKQEAGFQAEIDKRLKGGLPVDIPPPKAAPKAKAAKETDELKQKIADIKELEKVTGRLLKGEELKLLDLEIQLLFRDGTNFTPAQLQRQLDAIIDASKGRAEIMLPVAIPKEKIKTDIALIGRSLNFAVNLKPGLIVATKDFEDFKSNLEGIIENIKENILVGIGETLGEALAGGSTKDIFGGFMAVLADGLKAIGQAMIAYGVAKKVLENLKISGIGAIVAGIALIAAGAFLKTTMNKKRFAEGGIVTGPTNALIGEAGQPEVVFPLNKLNQFITKITGGNNQREITTVSVRGTDLLLAIRRTQGQLGGTFS